MARATRPPRPHRGRNGGVLLAWAIVGSFLVLSCLPMGSATARTSLGPPARPGVPSVAARAVSPSGVAPAGSVTGTFYTNTTRLQAISSAQAPCQSGYSSKYCYSGETSPSLLPLPNRQLAEVYQVFSNNDSLTCAGASSQTASRIGIAISSDNGSSFANGHLIGDTSKTVCPYFQQIEPSFTMDGLGHVVGAYVGANTTRSTLLATTPAYYYDYGAAVTAYGIRPSDALVFVRSTDNGSSFTNGTLVVTGGNIAHPSIASIGQTIYIAYENLSNGTSPLPNSYTSYVNVSNASYPVSVQVVVSTNDGASWSGPYNVPGENASQGYTAENPSLVVEKSGILAVAYVTNRSCVAYCAAATDVVSADDLVVSFGTSNASKWGAPHTVWRDALENGITQESIATGPYYFYQWESAPTTDLAYDPVTGDLGVVWASATNESVGSTSGQYSSFENLQVYAAVSSDGGTVWTPSTVGTSIYFGYSQYSDEIAHFNPAIAIRGGSFYVAYAEKNSTTTYSDGQCVFPLAFPSRTLWQSYSTWLVGSTDGVHWSYPHLLAYLADGGDAYYSYLGTGGAVGFAPSSAVVASEPIPATTNYVNSVYQVLVNLTTARPYAGSSTVNLTVSETGVPAGNEWGVLLDGDLFSSNGSSLNISGIPKGVTEQVLPALTLTNLGYGIARLPATQGGLYTYSSVSNSYAIKSTTMASFGFSVRPLNVPYVYVYFQWKSGATTLAHYDAQYQTYNYGNGQYYTYIYVCLGPWYFPLGLQFSIPENNATIYSTISYDLSGRWQGTGNGSYTGAGLPSANFQMNSSLNESYTLFPNTDTGQVTVGAPSLAPATTYSFRFDQTNYSAAGGSTVTVAGLPWGGYPLANITANSSTPGWDYFGSPQGGNPILVPEETSVNLTFASVDVAAAPVAVSFHALNLTNGTVWQLSFNGSTYASSTPWLNLSEHPGSYPASTFPVTASAQGSSSYAPRSFPATVNVTPGARFTIDYYPAYEVDVLPGFGGSVNHPGANWVSPGGSLALNESALPTFRWYGWTGSGTGAYSGPLPSFDLTVNGPMTEAASFLPLPANRFNLTFDQTGVPNGTSWTVFVDGVGYTGSGPSLVIPGVFNCHVTPSEGYYTVEVPYAYANASANLTRFVPGTYAPKDCGGGTYALTFSAQYELTLQASTGGGVTAAAGVELTSGSAWFDTNASVVLNEQAFNGYKFLGWNGSGDGSYTGTNASATVVILNPLTEVAYFQKTYVAPSPRYTVTLTASPGFVPGTGWSVSVGSAVYSAVGSTLNISGLLAGPYHFVVAATTSPDGLYRYTPTSPTFSLTISANRSYTVAFQAAVWLSITAAGPGTVSPSSGWFPEGIQVILNVTPIGVARFVGWSGSGPGSYTGPTADPKVNATGPFSEVATFIPGPPATNVLTSPWSNPSLDVGLALVGLAVGVTVGLLLLRARGRPPEPAAADTPATSAPESPRPDAEPIDPPEGA